MVALKFPLAAMLLIFSVNGSAGSMTGPQQEELVGIDVSLSDKGYTLIAPHAKLEYVLQELATEANFKLKLFEALNDEQKSWNFQAMSLTQLLDNLLRGYNTVMLYQEKVDVSANGSSNNQNHALKELWLLSQKETTDPDRQSGINVEIKLEQETTVLISESKLTPEQQYEVNAIDSLEGLNGDDVIETLQQMLVGGEDSVVRQRAVTALGDIGGNRILDALETGMRDSSAEVRFALADTLAQIKDQRSMLLLGQMVMGDHDAEVRSYASRALYQQHDPVGRYFVEAATKDKANRVKKVAAEILQQWPVVPADE